MMDVEMLKLYLASQGIPPDAVDALVSRLVEGAELVTDYLESGADMHRAQEAAALMAAAKNAHDLGQEALAAAFIEHAEWLVTQDDEGDEEVEPTLGTPTLLKPVS